MPVGDTSVGGAGAHADVRQTLQVLWRRKWILLSCALLLPIAAYLLSVQLPKSYEATAELEVQAQSVDTTLFAGELLPQGRSLASTARLVRTTGVARRAATELDPPPAEPRDLLSQITVQPDEEAGFLSITATDGDPERAAAIANAFATSIVDERAEKARRLLDETIDRLRSNIRDLDGDDRTGQRQLSEELQRMRALRAAQGANAQIVEPAVAPRGHVSPRPRRNAFLAAILGLLLGVGLAFLLERLNRKLREDREVETITGRPLLASVPLSAFGPARAVSGSRDADEAFQTLRASLTYFNVDREVDRVLVTSPAKGDGKTTVAVNLAMAYARAGKEVILIDADMRNPQVTKRLGLTEDYGLGSVLVGEMALTDALVEVEGLGSGRLRVLRAGPPPPNPSELIASERMQTLLNEVGELAHITIVDTPPILVVADAMPLFESASGVVAVARIGQTSRDALARLVSVVSAAGGDVLGVVVTGLKRGRLYGYGYGYDGYTPQNGATAQNGAKPEVPATPVR